MGQHAPHGTVHARRWVKVARRHEQHILHGVAPLQHHRQPAIGGRGRPGHDAVYDLFLQHEVLILNHVDLFQQVKQDGAGDVIGQVADNSYFRSIQCLRHLRKVHF